MFSPDNPLTDKELEESRKKISEQILMMKRKGIVFKPRKIDRVKTK